MKLNPITDVTKIPTTLLSAELKRRTELKATLQRQISELDVELAPLKTLPLTKAHPPSTVLEGVHAALSINGSMSVKQISTAVLAMGYETRAKNFQAVVQNAISNDRSVKRIAPRTYVLKGGS